MNEKGGEKKVNDKKVNDKKGISPLIATVLIIGFTIVLAVLVITWISGTVEDITADTDCMTEAQQVCLDSVNDLDLRGVAPGPLVLVNNGGSVLGEMVIVQYDSAGSTIAGFPNYNITSLAAFSTNNSQQVDALATSVSVIITAEGKNGECSIECTPVELTL
ncbi:hypothetical protein HN865_02745 [Candidatus Woesearchaeota archaeon]|jgi:flagellin-like protein|nr:hypothetical protein [Candidatus Woesearchaeota archaeon]MBT7237754.1 hypothetical protein [Candidatus Woesearchaeota archaeon]